MGKKSCSRGRGKGPGEQLILYSCCSNLLPRVGRRFGKIFKATQLPGSEQSLRGPYRFALGSATGFTEELQGYGPKSCQITGAGRYPGTLH